MISDSYLEGEPLRLSSGPQMLLDDVLVEDRFNLTRVLHYPVKHYRNPILVRDQPWEGDVIVKPHVIWDEEYGRYRMWYTCFNWTNYHGSGLVYYLGYAESDNGFDWEKPLFDFCPIGRYAKTNVLYAGNMADIKGKRMFACGQVFKDMRDPYPARRYKMIALDGRGHPRYPDDINTEVSLLISPDGLRWTLVGERPIFDSHSDTSNHMVYDEARGRWLLYCRPTVYATGRNGEDNRHHRRRLCVMTSRDLEHWSYPRVVLSPDERDLPDYDHAQTFRYGSHFMMLYAAMDGDAEARFETRLASSGDGLHWHRFHTRGNFIERGPQGAWDAGIIGPGCEPVPQGDNLLLYYTGNNLGQHENFTAQYERQGAIGVAIMKLDRFVAQRASGRTGYLLTREFLLEGDTLQVNISPDTRPYRQTGLRVEVLRHPPLGEHADYFYKSGSYTYAYEGFGLDDCIPLAGDGPRIQVRWKNRNLGELKGQPVYLRFELQEMDLYSFCIQNE
jgi:hypothetical protein